jgi:hypothetical protein
MALSMAARRAGASTIHPLAPLGEMGDERLLRHNERMRFVGRYEEKFGLFARPLNDGEDRAH